MADHTSMIVCLEIYNYTHMQHVYRYMCIYAFKCIHITPSLSILNMAALQLNHTTLFPHVHTIYPRLLCSLLVNILVTGNITILYKWRFPEMGVPPVIIRFSGILHYKPTSELGGPPFMETPKWANAWTKCGYFPHVKILKGKSQTKPHIKKKSSELQPQQLLGKKLSISKFSLYISRFAQGTTI